MLSHVNGTSSQIALCLPTKGCQHCHWSVELIIVCKPPNRGGTLFDTSGDWSIPYVISHDIVNLMIFCYDYELCLSTIITFEKKLLNKLYTIIGQTGQCISVFFLVLLG